MSCALTRRAPVFVTEAELLSVVVDIAVGKKERSNLSSSASCAAEIGGANEHLLADGKQQTAATMDAAADDANAGTYVRIAFL